MSRAGRGSKGKQSKRTRRSSELTLAPGTAQTCDCPACSGEGVDPEQMLDELLRDVATVASGDDAFDAELAGAAFLAAVTAIGEELVPTLVKELIPQIEAKRDSAALALLLATGTVAAGLQDQLATAAKTAAGRLAAAGIRQPRWAAALGEPVRVGDCVRLSDTGQTTSVLAASFRRGDHGQGFLIMVDEIDYVAVDIILVRGEDMPGALDDIRTGARGDGLDMRTEMLDPAELRWYAEQALDAVDPDWLAEPAWWMSDEDDDEEDGTPFAASSVLVRRWLADLPEARKPAGARPYPDPEDPHNPIGVEALASLLSGAGNPFGGLPFGRPIPAKLPAKRKKSNGPAPIYQIKVGLRGAKPPIWRRLLVPADVSLARLHDIIQVAFGWDGGHLHAFETPYGDFGHADPELGHRSEGPVTLEQVAPQAKDKIQYTYDFGDGWAHDIVVEKVLDRDSTLTYPRCTGGRRAAPPDDCGGIWGYQELIEIIADPRHPEHTERLAWLGLDDPRQFDPAAFDVDEVNELLPRLR
jgi:hypothetical protein